MSARLDGPSVSHYHYIAATEWLRAFREPGKRYFYKPQLNAGAIKVGPKINIDTFYSPPSLILYSQHHQLHNSRLV